jgi:hypothetical protein
VRKRRGQLLGEDADLAVPKLRGVYGNKSSFFPIFNSPFRAGHWYPYFRAKLAVYLVTRSL